MILQKNQKLEVGQNFESTGGDSDPCEPERATQRLLFLRRLRGVVLLRLYHSSLILTVYVYPSEARSLVQRSPVMQRSIVDVRLSCLRLCSSAH